MARKPKTVEVSDISVVVPVDETIHRLWIVDPKTHTRDIVERDCRIVVTEKITWAEPLMPLRGVSRGQKRFMLGAFAFYTRQQAVRKKLMLLVQLAKVRHLHQVAHAAHKARQQLDHFKETGELP